MDKQSLKLLLGQGLSVERIAKRFGKDPSTISYWMKRHGLESPFADKHAAKGRIERGRLEDLVGAGMTIAEIAVQVDRSNATVRHWLKRYGLRTKNGRGTREPGVTEAARSAGLRSFRRRCGRHGETEFVIEGNGYYRCKKCRADLIMKSRRSVKTRLVAEAGGACAICGYDRYPAALEFHHLDPEEKRMAISRSGSPSLEAIRAEVKKCVLLCSNCHAEVEAGAAVVPLEFARRGPE
jgi:transposase